MSTPDPKPAPVAGAEPDDIRALLRQRRFPEALAAAEALLARLPGNRDGLLFKAIAERFLGRVDEAVATLAALEREHPRFSRLHEERGHCYAALRKAPEAIDSFLKAVGFNNALPASWSMLEGLYRISQDAASASNAARELAALRKLAPEVVAGTGLFLDGDLDQAENMVRAYLHRQPADIEAMRLLARVGMARKVYEDAEVLLSAVVELVPDYRAARADYAETLIELHKPAQAVEQLERLLREDPGNRQHYQGMLATASVGLGEHERAIELYRSVLQGTSADADVHLSIAHALKTVGRRDEAIGSYRQAAKVRPRFGDAYWSLANLKTYHFTPDELARMRELEADAATPKVDRYHLCFALGKALEDQGDYAASFGYYERGNALKRAESQYSAELIETNTRLQIETCTVNFFARLAECGAPDPDPIFIVGLPRSGSTLIEQILASHSKVEGTLELPNVQQIVARLRGRKPDPANPRYPGILKELKGDDFREMGERYLRETRVYRHGRPFFIDKMPNNFRHLGLIHAMLPNARIIDARREPMACCFSNLKQLFAKGQEFTYSIEDIARYYRTYLELMRHWMKVLPGRILLVHHEDVVNDLEGNVRRILEFCGLEFESACVQFHLNERSVRTASSEQVRQPIYREGLEHWKHYEPWLGPLRNALGDALTRYRE